MSIRPRENKANNYDANETSSRKWFSDGSTILSTDTIGGISFQYAPYTGVAFMVWPKIGVAAV